MNFSDSIVSSRDLAKSYGLQMEALDATTDSIQERVEKGQVVGEWNGSFQIYALPEVANRRSLRWKEEALSGGELKVSEIKNLWQALDYFGEGELDVLITSEEIFVFPQEGRKILETIRSILEKNTGTDVPPLMTDFDFESEDPFLNNLQGKLLTLEGNISKAGKAFGKAISLLPEYSEPYANLGTLLWQLGQKREAFTLFVESLLRNPHNTAAQLNFFDAGRETEEFDSMIKVIEQILKVEADCLEFYPILAFCYHRSGQAGKAMDILSQFLEKHPEEKEAKLLLEHIKSHLQ